MNVFCSFCDIHCFQYLYNTNARNRERCWLVLANRIRQQIIFVIDLVINSNIMFLLRERNMYKNGNQQEVRCLRGSCSIVCHAMHEDAVRANTFPESSQHHRKVLRTRWADHLQAIRIVRLSTMKTMSDCVKDRKDIVGITISPSPVAMAALNSTPALAAFLHVTQKRLCSSGT